jgi:hypothetical protein
MFEAEEKLESRSLSGPLLVVMLIVLAAVGSAWWFILHHTHLDLTADQAKPVIEQSLKARAAPSIHFYAGTVPLNDNPRDPHYKLLEKLGIVKTAANPKSTAVRVDVTPAGKQLLAAIPEFKQRKDSDGIEAYVVPLAGRELVQVTKVAMTGPNSARVDYTWKWDPNQLGKDFDATSQAVQSFNSWERSTLIQKYGVDFYNETQTSSVNLVRVGNDWEVATE